MTHKSTKAVPTPYPAGQGASTRTYPDRGVHGRVVRTIAEDIISGRYPQEHTLPPEPELMARLGVSRTAVREAIKVLAAKGLVKSRPKTGTRVQRHEDWNLLDPDILSWHALVAPDNALLDNMIDLRAIIEPKAARLAAENATVDEIKAIRAEADAMAGAVNDFDRFSEFDLRFHKALLNATGNRFLICMAPMVDALLRSSFAVQSRSLIPSSQSISLHDTVAEAIASRDPDRAETAMLKIIDVAKRQIKNVTGRSGQEKG